MTALHEQKQHQSRRSRPVGSCSNLKTVYGLWEGQLSGAFLVPLYSAARAETEAAGAAAVPSEDQDPLPV